MDQQIGTYRAARLGALSLSFVGGLSSCSSANQATPTSTESPIVSADAAIGCARDPRGEAFTADLTYQQLQAGRGSVLDEVYACKMPEAPVPPITAADRTTLLTWIECGGPNN